MIGVGVCAWFADTIATGLAPARRGHVCPAFPMSDPSEQLRLPAAHAAHAEQAERDAVLVARLRQASARPGGLADSDARAALSTLIERYQHRLFAICLRMVSNDREAAADLTQDALLKIIQGLGGYDGRSSLSTWAIRVTMNVCLSYLRSSRVRKHPSLDLSTPGNDDSRGSIGDSLTQSRELSGEQSVEQRERRRRVAAGLASLEPEQRGVLVLRDVQGLEYEQIAEVLQVPVGTVKSRLFRARLALRDSIEGRAES